MSYVENNSQCIKKIQLYATLNDFVSNSSTSYKVVIKRYPLYLCVTCCQFGSTHSCIGLRMNVSFQEIPFALGVYYTQCAFCPKLPSSLCLMVILTVKVLLKPNLFQKNPNFNELSQYNNTDNKFILKITSTCQYCVSKRNNKSIRNESNSNLKLTQDIFSASDINRSNFLHMYLI